MEVPAFGESFKDFAGIAVGGSTGTRYAIQWYTRTRAVLGPEPRRVMTPTVCNCSKYATPPSPSLPKTKYASNWPPLPQLERNVAPGRPHFVTAAFSYSVILDPFHSCHCHGIYHCHLHCHHHHNLEGRGGDGQAGSPLNIPFLPSYVLAASGSGRCLHIRRVS